MKRIENHTDLLVMDDGKFQKALKAFMELSVNDKRTLFQLLCLSMFK